MSLSTIGIASMQRSSDIASIVQNDNSRAASQQANVQNTIEKNIQQKQENVVQKESVQLGNQKFDARDQSSNEYVDMYEKKKKKEKKEEQETGTVTIKNHSKFDVSV